MRTRQIFRASGFAVAQSMTQMYPDSQSGKSRASGAFGFGFAFGSASLVLSPHQSPETIQNTPYMAIFSTVPLEKMKPCWGILAFFWTLIGTAGAKNPDSIGMGDKIMK